MKLKNFVLPVGKKAIMAVTGACLALFIITHLLGNLLIFVGPQTLNLYAHKLTSHPAIYIAEALLALIFIVHIVTGLSLFHDNIRARPQGYAHKGNTQVSTWASSSMPYTGMLILVGLIIHLINFKFGPVHTTVIEGIQIRDFKYLLTVFFSSTLNTVTYLFAMLIVALHVSHGAWSIFQSLGLNNDKIQSFLKKGAFTFAVIIFILYSSIPLSLYFLAKV